MKHFSYFLSILFVLFVSACSSDEPAQKEVTDAFEKNEPSKPRVDIPLSRSETEIVNHITDYSFDVLNLLAEKHVKNVTFSPLSLSSVLSILANGADGETRSELLSTLKTSNLDELNQLNKKLLETLPSLDNNVRFNSANAFFHDGLEIQNNFISALNNYFNASIFPCPLKSTQGLNSLNQWITDNSWGILQQYGINSLFGSKMHFFNITAFMARWTNPFEESNTKFGPLFTNENGVAQNAYMMYKEEYMPYYKGENYQATSMSYGNGAFKFTVILPDTDSNIYDVIANLSVSEFNKIKKPELVVDLHFTLPRFKNESSLDLYFDIFPGLGLTDLESGNYNNICPEAVINNNRQCAVIEVNESGTKAAAITDEELMISDYNGVPPTEFKVNRPFIYTIHEQSTGAIMFIGIVRDMNLK